MVMAYFKALAKFRRSTVGLAYITYIYFVTRGMFGIDCGSPKFVLRVKGILAIEHSRAHALLNTQQMYIVYYY